MSRPCLVLLGGSFDPVHNAHVALGSYFARLLVPDELRIIPAGNPWQKDPLNASAADRVAMLAGGTITAVGADPGGGARRSFASAWPIAN